MSVPTLRRTSSVLRVEYWQWLCKCLPSSCATIHPPARLMKSVTAQGTAMNLQSRVYPECFISLHSSVFIWNLFRRGFYLTDCTEMLFTSFDWLSSSNMYFLKSPIYDSYANNLSVYSVHRHQDHWMVRRILNGFFILNSFFTPVSKMAG
jgi:hypothetical protein